MGSVRKAVQRDATGEGGFTLVKLVVVGDHGGAGRGGGAAS